MTTIPDLGVQRRGSVLWPTIQREERRNALSSAELAGGLFPAQAAEQALAMAFEEAMAFTECQVALFAQTEDAREGLAAFRELRAPQWTGR